MCSLLLVVLVVPVEERIQKAMAADWLEGEKGAWGRCVGVVGGGGELWLDLYRQRQARGEAGSGDARCLECN